jgi:hypothetical protein
MYKNQINDRKILPAAADSFKQESTLSKRQASATLVLHPEDATTDFLSAIYADKGWDVLSAPGMGRTAVKTAIQNHDRIVMLGHGSPRGLFGRGSFLVDEGLVPLLRQKKIVAIWCHADEFVKQHDLSGFYSGMFISELAEAWLCGISNTDVQAIQRSNALFAAALGRWIDCEYILEQVLEEYMVENDPVIAFNRDRLYCR